MIQLFHELVFAQVVTTHAFAVDYVPREAGPSFVMMNAKHMITWPGHLGPGSTVENIRRVEDRRIINLNATTVANILINFTLYVISPLYGHLGFVVASISRLLQ